MSLGRRDSGDRSTHSCTTLGHPTPPSATPPQPGARFPPVPPAPTGGLGLDTWSTSPASRAGPQGVGETMLNTLVQRSFYKLKL